MKKIKKLLFSQSSSYLIWSFLVLVPCLIACSKPKLVVATPADSVSPVPSNLPPKPSTYRFAFYNVENLMDTLDNPLTADEDFTPQGDNKWNTKRYATKLEHLAKVVEAMNYPEVLGLTEIENADVVRDLLAQSNLTQAGGYAFVHYDSPDRRGIDVAFAYKRNLVQVIEHEKIAINFPEGTTKTPETTRDILHVKTKIAGEIIHFFVNHWSSRRGGEKESEPKRIYIASVLRKAIDGLQKNTPDARIVILGDFNDEPSDRSVTETLKAIAPSETPNASQLYDVMATFQQKNEGSYLYKGHWDMIDNIVLSGNLLNPQAKVYCQNPTIFKANFMLYTDKQGVKGPSRSYGGNHYYGGYSDHLPVLIEALIRNK